MKAPLRSGISRKPAPSVAKATRAAKAAAPAGVVTGLALTTRNGRNGATAATVECLPLPGRGKIILTGNLVGSARDAAHLAVSLARARTKHLGLDPALFLCTDFHFHVMDPLPPKGGPSIGLPMFLALVSALTRKPVDPASAFTGELSLTGKVYAVEGVAAKAKAAARAGMTKLYAPAENVAELAKKNSRQKSVPAMIAVENADAALESAGLGLPRGKKARA